MNMADNEANCFVCYHDARAHTVLPQFTLDTEKKFHAACIYAAALTNLRRVARNLAHTRSHQAHRT